jgi:hypothetical protein
MNECTCTSTYTGINGKFQIILQVITLLFSIHKSLPLNYNCQSSDTKVNAGFLHVVPPTASDKNYKEENMKT